jgi:hypothetical protein
MASTFEVKCECLANSGCLPSRWVSGLPASLLSHSAQRNQPPSQNQLPVSKTTHSYRRIIPRSALRSTAGWAILGKCRFTIDNLAAGIRYVFIHATHVKHIQQMFIIQQEGFLPSSDDTYKYSITNPARLGSFEYQHSVIFDDNAATIRDDPGKEADVTQRFLTAHGYFLEQELVMARFARPSDPQHKHEIIFFCFENLSAYGRSLADLSKDPDSPNKQAIKKKWMRTAAAFSV